MVEIAHSETRTWPSGYFREGSPKRRQLAWAILLVFIPFAAGYFLSYFFRTANALISRTLTEEFQLGVTQLGLVTAVYFLSAAIQLPIGTMVDRWGPRRMQSVLLLIAAAGALQFAFADSVGALISGRTLMGIGAGAAVVSGFKAIVLWFPRERLVVVNGYFVMAGALGAVAATAPADLLLTSLGWRGLFEVLAAATALCAVVTFLVVPELSRSTGRRPGVASLMTVLRSRRFWHLAPLSTMCISTAWALQGLWVAPWLQDVEGLGSSAIVHHLFVMALALSSGSLVLGMCASSAGRRGLRIQDVMSFAATLFIAAEVALVLDARISSYVLWSVIAVLGGASVLTYAMLANCFPPGLIGQANAALSTCHIAGTLVLQYGVGAVIGSWPTKAGHYPAVAYRTAFAIVIALQVMALVWFALPDRASVRRLISGASVGTRKPFQFERPTSFLAALHESRRSQAAREIERYRHLIDDGGVKAMQRLIRQSHRQTVGNERSSRVRTAAIGLQTSLQSAGHSFARMLTETVRSARR